MKVIIVSSADDGTQIDVFPNVDEIYVGGERIVRPSTATVLVVS